MAHTKANESERRNAIQRLKQDSAAASARGQGDADAARVPIHGTAEGDGSTGHGGYETERGGILLYFGGSTFNHITAIVFGETYLDKFLRSCAEASRPLPRRAATLRRRGPRLWT